MLAELLLGLALLYLLWFAIFKKPDGLPPGRWGLPLVGYIPLNGKRMDEQFKDLHKQHGDIYVWRMGTQVNVFLHSYQLSREALSSSDFLDRPIWELFRFLEPVTLGVIGSNGNIWHINRRFSLRQLRDQGMGKSSLVSAVQNQANKLIEALKGQANKSERIPRDLRVAVINIIWHMVASKQFEVTDPKLQEFIDIIDDLTQKFGPLAIPDFMPWIKYCLPDFLIRRVFSVDILYTLKDKFFDYCKELIEEHKSSLDPDNPRDLMDGYLLDIEASKDNPDGVRTERDLCILILDLFFAGSETTVGTLTFMIYYLANYPEVQKKFQAEIDEVLPKGTLATLEDRSRMPYTEAVIHEVLRVSSLASVGVPHVAVRDTKLGGYLLPKGTIVSTAAAAMHHDPRYWNEPEKFKPERWLDDQGKFTTKKEGFLPFGVGKRVCVGESLARMELFILSTALFQSLSVTPPPGSKVDVSPDPSNPFGHNPRSEKVCFTIRE
ncbi:cytochrome P450 2L1-like [Penaeus chinensis]|uniref:cytochrome P450 2L1-like n=1 Tax=Penaeus chinensis TaxID=139456 RepID=UPI001FB57662|nr:cytochrome P450 2L1-like [Penaeus chinensis]XP_047472153.1 cytochrome P450 2L1-like [Penaeus chinensis]XP_047472154.1 cytochrome P450 2L1-like [Penaeus chinensis]